MSARFHQWLDIASLAAGAFCIGMAALNCLYGYGEPRGWWL